jgi:hypothetical protein
VIRQLPAGLSALSSRSFAEKNPMKILLYRDPDAKTAVRFGSTQ